ncbi:hypothetical protein Pfo_020695 [Paulownia fortunei]|nr:hypothetical protein Pfo_020695 [Paulownia fortunei]
MSVQKNGWPDIYGVVFSWRFKESNTFYSCSRVGFGQAHKSKMAVEEIGSDCFSEELHVLAVDDSLVDRKVIEKLLKISCCKVTSVESGRRALQYLGLDGERSSVGFDGLNVNLIITDYSMPGMTGYELLKKIKGSSKLRKIPVVIMSSENVLAHIDRCMEEGAEEFLVKPVKLSDVKRLRDFILRGEEENQKRVSRKRKMLDDACPLMQPSASSPLSLNCDLPLPPKSVLAVSKQRLLKRPRLLK